jgi:integrase
LKPGHTGASTSSKVSKSQNCTPKHSDRVLSDEEIRIAWRAFDSVGWPFGPIGQLLLLTGARKNEVAGMKWSEIDLDARIWSLPQERTKNKREHELPLSAAAVRIIEALPRIGDKMRGFVFTTTGNSAVSGFSRFKTSIDETVLELSKEQAELRGDDPAKVEALAPWILHDLRRTVATNLQKLGVKLEVTEAVLNHVSGTRAGVVGLYQRHDYRDEKRQALDAWARHLGAIIDGEGPADIVRLARTKR